MSNQQQLCVTMWAELVTRNSFIALVFAKKHIAFVKLVHNIEHEAYIYCIYTNIKNNKWKALLSQLIFVGNAIVILLKHQIYIWTVLH